MLPDRSTARVSTTAGIGLALARENDIPESAIDSLSPQERAYAAGRLRARRRLQFVGGRFLLRRLLEQQTEQPARHHDIYATEQGKPRCASGIAISIAHTRDVIVCAFAAVGEVGVDVERCDPRRDWQRLARRCFSTSESAWLETRELSEHCQHWVLKEAWLKMLGTGISGGLSRLECRIAPPVIEAHFAVGAASHLSLFAWNGAFIGLATDRVDHGNPILLACRNRSEVLEPMHDVLRLAGSEPGQAGADRIETSPGTLRQRLL